MLIVAVEKWSHGPSKSGILCALCCEEFHFGICLTHINTLRISIHIQSQLGPTKYNKTSICHFNILHSSDSPHWPNKYNKYTQGQ